LLKIKRKLWIQAVVMNVTAFPSTVVKREVGPMVEYLYLDVLREARVLMVGAVE
jgi:hypothetical protein